MLHKSFDIIETKADGDAGTFEATVAVFHNVDKGGDRIVPGAFKTTLAEWKASGDPIPVILSHQWDNPFSHIGVVEDAKETDKGLWVKGRLDVLDNNVARQVHRLMQRRSLKEFSFGYEVALGGEKRAKDGANDLTDLRLAEIGPTLKGMNPATELHAVKSAVVEQKLETDVARLTERVESIERALADTGSGSKAKTDAEDPRTVDSLRKQADAVALEVAQGGISLPKSKQPDPPPQPDLMPLAELKQRMRAEMLQVLSGGIPEES